ncbi:MAG: molecular chaperone DnaJ [Planctomycetaceae bacterium]|nr:molecular chaperone DnaJ [Planctomycetaceae bacterium]
MSSKRCYYEVLEVSREASPDQIKKSYKKLAVQFHPDRNPGDDTASVRFKEVAEAYEILSDPERRSRYDRYGHAGVDGNMGGGGAGFEGFHDAMDLFSQLFGGAGGFGGQSRRSRGGAQRGSDLRAVVEIDLLEAANGCTRDLEFDRQETCETCKGSRAKPGSKPESCDYCGGQGQVVQRGGGFLGFAMAVECPRCNGMGTIVRDKCDDCRGTGRNPEHVKINVKVPAGVDTGNRISLRGEGESGVGGGPRGDLMIDIRVKEHPLFQRENKHLTCRVPVTYPQAVLGTELEIPVLKGRHTLTIPKGTQPGEIIRLRGFGMPDVRGGATGDLFVQVQLEVPKKVSDEEEDLLRQLADLKHADVTPHRKSFFEKVKEYFTGHEEAET